MRFCIWLGGTIREKDSNEFQAQSVFDNLWRVLRSTAIFIRIELPEDLLAVVYRINDLHKYTIISSFFFFFGFGVNCSTTYLKIPIVLYTNYIFIFFLLHFLISNIFRFLKLLFKNNVSIFSPLWPPAPSIPTSHPLTHPLWLCPHVLHTGSLMACPLLSPIIPLPPPLWLFIFKTAVKINPPFSY